MSGFHMALLIGQAGNESIRGLNKIRTKFFKRRYITSKKLGSLKENCFLYQVMCSTIGRTPNNNQLKNPQDNWKKVTCWTLERKMKTQDTISWVNAIAVIKIPVWILWIKTKIKISFSSLHMLGFWQYKWFSSTKH